MSGPAVLLISPGIIKWTDMDFGLPHLVSLGGYLQAHTGVRVEILDLNYEGGDHRQLERRLQELAPFLLIGLSCYSSFDYMRVMSLGRFLKHLYPHVPLVTGGYHASALPEDLLGEGSPFEAVAPGEGEMAMREMVECLLGGASSLDRRVYDKAVVEDLDQLPPYRWELLHRYWPRALDVGRKLQVYLSRGCPYRCTFCMERSKSGYRWRAFSPERAIDELRRLSRFTDLSRWVVNLADPLFGFQRRWRRQVLEGILEESLLPRQYWTLTRSDDLEDEDVRLLAAARFSIGIGMESGSPEMLSLMQKGNTPERYLAALERLAELSRRHGMNWAANIIVGHPGESSASMRATFAFVERLFTSASETCGWLSIDAFRLYPGSHVYENMEQYASRYGSRFYHPTWWRSWYDAPFRAEHIDPSAEVDFETRVRFMYASYGPLLEQIIRRFRGQGRSVDRVFERSLNEQARQISTSTRDQLLSRAAWSRSQGPQPTPASLTVPIGIHVRNPEVRRRESAVSRLLGLGVLRTERIVEALLTVPADRYLSPAECEQMFADSTGSLAEGTVPFLPLRDAAMALEALNPGLGERAADLLASRGYVAAILSELVGPDGEVVALAPGRWRRHRLAARLGRLCSQVTVARGVPVSARGLVGSFDALWLGGALPELPRVLLDHLRDRDARLVTWLGPRFRPQDLVCITRESDGVVNERRVARSRVPVVAGNGGWLASQAGSGW